MSRQLLREFIPFSVDRKLLEESFNTNNPFYAYGVLQRANVKNHNGRIYPKEILEKEIERYKKEFVEQNRALGELDHPDSSVVNLAQVSHNIVEIGWDGNDVIGKVKVLGTPAGKILMELFRSGITVGISSRGLGSTEEIREGETRVLDDFELIAFDFVSNPSTHRAFMYPERKSVNESIKPEAGYNYSKIDSIIADILCSTAGMCDIEKIK